MKPVYNIPKSNFTIIPNDLLKDVNLSDGAKVLAFYLMSLPNDWNIVWCNVAKALNTSLSTIKRRKKELLEGGYLLISKESKIDTEVENSKNVNFYYFKYKADDLQKYNIDKTDYQKEELCENVENGPNLNESNLNPINNIKYITKNKKEKIYKKEKNFIVFQHNPTLFNKLITTEEKNNTTTKELFLESFLDEEELVIAKEWVKWRQEMWNIKPKVSISKLKREKEKGSNIKADLEFCMQRDYRGYFNAHNTTKPPKQVTHTRESLLQQRPVAKSRIEVETQRKEHFYILEILEEQGWTLGKMAEDREFFIKIKIENKHIARRKNGWFCFA